MSFHIFSKSFRRSIRSTFINKIHLFILQSIQPFIPLHVVEFIIKSMHFQCVFVAFSALFLLPFVSFVMIFITHLLLFLLFLYFDGCVLTCIEYKLCQNKSQFINIIDPFLYLLHLDINDINRYFVPLYISVFYFYFAIMKLSLFFLS